MRKSRHDIYQYQQAYNAQAVVDAESSQLIVVADVVRTPADANQLEPAVRRVPQPIGAVEVVLADCAYVNADAFDRLQEHKVEVYVPVSGEDQNVRKYDYRPPSKRRHKKVNDPRLVAMREKLPRPEGKRIYSKHDSTVELGWHIGSPAGGYGIAKTTPRTR